MKITDEMLYRHAAEARDIWLDTLPDDNEIPEHQFSDEFNKEMDRLITLSHKRKQPSRRLQRIAAMFAVIIIGASCFIGVNAEARAAFVSWVRSVFDGGVVFHYQGEPQDAGIPNFHCAWLPEGMNAEELLNSDNSGYVIYSDENDRICTLFYIYMVKGSAAAIFDMSGTGLPYEAVTINGSHGELYSSGEDYVLIWFDEASGIAFNLNSTCMSSEEIIKMAESVKEGAVLDYMPEYKFTWLPDGYQMDTELTRGSHECHLSSSSPEGKNLRLKYDIFEEASLEEQFRIKSETSGVALTVEGQDAVLYLNIPDGKNSLLWLDKDAGIAFRLEAEEDQETMLAIAAAVNRK